MAIFKSDIKTKPINFLMSYKQREAPIYLPMENKLCEEMGLTRSDLHKTAIRFLNNSRQQQQSAMVY